MNFFARGWLAGLQKPPAGASDPVEAAPPATTVIDPKLRLEALRGQDPGRDRDAVVYWTALAEAADATGETDLQLDALGRLWRVSPSDGPNLRFAEVATEQGRRLREARRAVQIAVSGREDAPVPTDGSSERWRAQLAEALDVRARVWAALDRPSREREDLERALALAPPTPDRALRLGLLYADLESHDAAYPLLARGLGGSEAPADERARRASSALSDALTRAGVWAPGGAEGYVAAVRASDMALEEDAPVLDGRAFDAFEVVVADASGAFGGAAQRLLDLEGPLVVDLWSTSCGPCMLSLPHLDQLAREYEGRVTFLAVSVDDRAEKAQRYLAKSGEHTFVSAYAGLPAMGTLGVEAIPATFVFDTNHRLVGELRGWEPGNTALDEAVEAALAR
jgi:thiol-disulfide isomerase/thioredoxin